MNILLTQNGATRLNLDNSFKQTMKLSLYKLKQVISGICLTVFAQKSMKMTWEVGNRRRYCPDFDVMIVSDWLMHVIHAQQFKAVERNSSAEIERNKLVGYK